MKNRIPENKQSEDTVSVIANKQTEVPKSGDFTNSQLIDKKAMNTTNNENGNVMNTHPLTVDPVVTKQIDAATTVKFASPTQAGKFLIGLKGLHTPIVDNLLYSGLTLICADTKTGASTLSLYLAGRISMGKPVFGTHQSQMQRVCYITTGGDPIRLADTIEKLNRNEETEISNLKFDLITDVSHQDSKFIEYLDRVISVRKLKAVFIDGYDTLYNRTQRNSEANFFDRLNSLGIKHNTTIVVNYSMVGSPFRGINKSNKVLKTAQNIINLADFGSSELVNSISDRCSILELKGVDVNHLKMYYQWGNEQDIQFNILANRPPIESSDITLKKITLCLEHGMSQTSIAMVLDVTQGYVSQLIQGHDNPTDSDTDFDEFPEIEAIYEDVTDAEQTYTHLIPDRNKAGDDDYVITSKSEGEGATQ